MQNAVGIVGRCQNIAMWFLTPYSTKNSTLFMNLEWLLTQKWVSKFQYCLCINYKWWCHIISHIEECMCTCDITNYWHFSLFFACTTFQKQTKNVFVSSIFLSCERTLNILMVKWLLVCSGWLLGRCSMFQVFTLFSTLCTTIKLLCNKVIIVVNVTKKKNCKKYFCQK